MKKQFDTLSEGQEFKYNTFNFRKESVVIDRNHRANARNLDDDNFHAHFKDSVWVDVEEDHPDQDHYTEE